MSEYLQNRLEPEIKWYERKSAFNKCMLYAFRIVTIFCSALLIFLGYFEHLPHWTVGLIGTCIILIEALDGFLKPQENWINYRTTAETLKHEKELFLSKAGDYTSGNAQLLAEKCELLISREHSIWLTHSKKKHQD
ncbi:hypothetical protein COU80_01600 [Candidatus Peregrinibacteria bacterium CG10_big_fil_rev_8_21_14_0_10_55_24]|nr:MAG: hypothetical protein COU80_01600 [Candidatus Peregrinibacteria bacterium CG10_big_fil_rev_8_21_14_0_10_55_24]